MVSCSKFQFHFIPCLMMVEVSLKTLPKNVMIQGRINSENSMDTTESTNTNIQNFTCSDFGDLLRCLQYMHILWYN